MGQSGTAVAGSARHWSKPSEQLTRALAQIATLPATPALRREEIKLQVALITPLMHVKGYAAPETKAAAERARLLIEQAEALGEPPEDPLLLFSVLYGFWVASYHGIQRRRDARACGAVPGARREARGDRPAHDRASPHGHFLAVYGRHRGRPSALDQAIALYDPAEHRPLATRFGTDVGVAILSYRSLALWMLGYPEAALADAEHALKDAREIGQAATLMYALVIRIVDPYPAAEITRAANALVDELSLWRTKRAPRSGRRAE